MNNIKSKFSIKDLENLSGIKAHTIRIWEKRYNLFQPNRTETNIRYYSLASLQKILNISYLNNNGYKISKIAALKPEEVPVAVKKIAEKKDETKNAVNKLKLAMMNFDQGLFYNTYNDLISEHSFQDVFYNIFVPLLDEIGLLWQTDTITPAHEHFIVELIKNKIVINTEKALNTSQPNQEKITYVLFLPDNEVHELGLLYSNYEIINKGHHCIYLGQSVPIDSLEFLLTQYENITFVSCFTVMPLKEALNNYLQEFQNKLLKNNSNKLIVSGRMTTFIEELNNPKISVFKTTKEVVLSI
ncbi:MAG: MerR family transcriptional regulator [Olleya sp.]